MHNREVLGHANSQDKYTFVKNSCRVSSESLQTFQFTAGSEFRRRFSVFILVDC